MNAMTRYVIYFIAFAFPVLAISDEILETLPNGLQVYADYHDGEEGKVAILVQHGFMATHRFPTVENLVGELADQGYTVLAPTLSLNIPLRKTAIACDTIHTHHFDMDKDELEWWLKWLEKKGHEKIVLIGHSSGSLLALAYVQKNPLEAVQLVIDTSLTYFESGESDTQQNTREEGGGHSSTVLKEHYLSYCKGNYLSPENAYLSYASWNSERVLSAVKETYISLEVVMGGRDERQNPDWLTALQEAGAKVTIIDGANHFFDSEHEFELHDAVTTLLTEYGY